jgi:hypothetical protein
MTEWLERCTSEDFRVSSASISPVGPNRETPAIGGVKPDLHTADTASYGLHRLRDEAAADGDWLRHVDDLYVPVHETGSLTSRKTGQRH